MNTFVHEAFADADVVHVLGEVDLSNAADLANAVLALADESRRVIVDLSGCSYIDSSTLNVLVHLQGEFGPRLRSVVPERSRLRRLFEIARLTDVVRLAYSIEEAREP
ncbi:MAG: STAS domain-containing protein [bacterium]|nr:STAS domain-containing protein [bacterium]